MFSPWNDAVLSSNDRKFGRFPIVRPIMPTRKLDRMPSLRDRVEDTLSAHRNELVSLLSRFASISKFSFFFLGWGFLWCNLCLVTEKTREKKKRWTCLWFIWRYVAQGKGILQPHTLLDEIENVVADDEARENLSAGPFGDVIKAAQVDFSFTFSLLFSRILFLFLFFKFKNFFRTQSFWNRPV